MGQGVDVSQLQLVNEGPVPPSVGPVDSADLVRQIESELGRLLDAVWAGELLYLTLAIAAIWIGGALGLRLLRRAVGRRGRVQESLEVAAALVAFFATALIVLGFLYRHAPGVGIMAIATLVFGAVLSASLRLRPWLSGIAVLAAGRIRVGDSLSTGTDRGIVEGVGLVRIRLRGDEGALKYLPVSAIGDQAFAVASARHEHPVEVRVRDLGEDLQVAQERARRLALLCPYREASSPVSVAISEPDGAVPQELVVRFRAWSPEAARLARDYITAFD